MAYPVPTREPASIVAGDTLAWRKTLSDYPAGDGWVLGYRLINAAGKIDITTAADGDDHLVGVSAATSADYAPGDYTWTSHVTLGAARHTVEQGRITIRPNLAGASGGLDIRSTAKKTLELLDAALIAHGANAWTGEYEIAGRRMKFRSPGDFLAMRDKLKAEVAREVAAERLAAGLGSQSKVYVRF